MSEDSKPPQYEPPFLARWSQLKREAREAPPATPPTPAPLVKLGDATPDLAALDTFTLESDWRGYFNPAVDEYVRRGALKKLFSDPHFNVMDGLDVYVDDYSLPNVLPEAMLGQLRQAQNILAWAKMDEPQPEQSAARVAKVPAADAGTASDPCETKADDAAANNNDDSEPPDQSV
jgi:hypothetical protein